MPTNTTSSRLKCVICVNTIDTFTNIFMILKDIDITGMHVPRLTNSAISSAPRFTITIVKNKGAGSIIHKRGESRAINTAAMLTNITTTDVINI